MSPPASLPSVPCHIDFLSPFSAPFSKCTHPACTRSLPSALYMHHPSKLMTSLKGLLQYKVCILSNILSAFVPLPPPCFPKDSDFIYNMLKWMGNYQAVLVQVQIKADREKAASCQQYLAHMYAVTPGRYLPNLFL